ALANASLLFHLGPGGVIAARIVTGAALAGVYPPALKLVATWFTRDRGLALGAVIGALTIGSALPHLFRAVLTASLATTVGALLFLLFAREGPYPFGKAVFEPSRIGQVFRERPLLLANLGYLGHMWELYAMWAWLLAYTRSAFEAHAIGSAAAASLSTFFVVASGIIGCLLGGYLSDRIGRTATTAGMMIVSGSCALLMGFLFAGPLWLFMLVAVVWGISVIGDSAQFSAAVTELGDRRFVGTALSVQLGAGFALTVLAIWLTPRFADFIGGWRWAFLLLVPGPLLGAAAMLWLRNLPESEKMAGGLR
ncbi:MAG: MFS transporter, partial [Mesorhizobium sp.]